MQQTMHSFVCGIKRSESSLVLPIVIDRKHLIKYCRSFSIAHAQTMRFVRFTIVSKIGVPDFDRNVSITRKVNKHRNPKAVA